MENYTNYEIGFINGINYTMGLLKLMKDASLSDFFSYIDRQILHRDDYEMACKATWTYFQAGEKAKKETKADNLSRNQQELLTKLKLQELVPNFQERVVILKCNKFLNSWLDYE